MALTNDQSIRIPPGYARRTRYYNEISDGIRPALELLPVTYLPVVLVDNYLHYPYVILAGSIIANTTLGTESGVTFANGGTAMTVTYLARDVYSSTDPNTYPVEDIDNLGNLVTVAGAAVQTDPANLPIGYASNAIYSEAYNARVLNHRIQDKVAVVCDQFIEIPLLTTNQTTGATAVASGCLIVPDPGTAGVSIRWQNGVNSVEQIIGRCIRVETIAAQGGLDKVWTTKGMNLPGIDTSGVPSHLDHSAATTSAKINITLA